MLNAETSTISRRWTQETESLSQKIFLGIELKPCYLALYLIISASLIWHGPLAYGSLGGS